MSSGHYSRVNHPSILANAVYIDETAAVSVNRNKPGEDVRFHSSFCWVWWYGISLSSSNQAEAIDGSTGYRVAETLPQHGKVEANHRTTTSDSNFGDRSTVCTQELVKAFLDISTALKEDHNQDSVGPPPRTLSELLEFKSRESPFYQEAKNLLHTKHPIFRQWKRRKG
ncbi:hypothetical protein ACA910_009905 [Epithemia clementina (nom. ined.)]